MAFPQIGLDAVLQISQFEKNARTYNRTLDGMNKKTKASSAAISKSTQGAASSAFDLTKGFRDAADSVDDTAASAASGGAKITASFGQIATAAGIVTAGIGGTIAALDKLLKAGEEAARLQDIRSAFINLSASSGISAQKLLADLQAVSRGTIETQTMLETANDALLAGGEVLAAKLPQFLAIAQGAARATGKDVGFVFQTLVEGAIKGSPLLIDNAKVYIKLGNAVDDYATSIGKTVDQLSEQERQFAVTNAIMAKGGDFLERLGSGAISAAEPFDQLKAQSSALSMGLKTLLAPAATYAAQSLQGLLTAAKTTIAGIGAAGVVLTNFRQNVFSAAQAGDTFRTEFDRIFQTLSLGTTPIEDIKGGLGAIGTTAEASTKAVDELNKKLADLATQRGDRLAKIELQNARRDQDITIQRGRQLADADRQLGRQREDAEKANAKAREKISRDNAQRITDVEKDNQKKRRSITIEAQRAREDLDRTHQENLFQINQKATDTIGEAARRNDAVAIAQALRQKQRDLRDNQRTAQVEKQDLQRDLQEKRRSVDEDSALALEKARQQAAQTLADQQANEMEQEEALKLSLQRREDDRNLAWQRQNEDLVLARVRQLEDLDLWYKSEQEKLDENLKKQTEIAVAGVQKSGVAIAQAATTAIRSVAESTIGLSADEQWRQRGNYLGSETTPSSIGLSEEDQRRLRGSFLNRRAEGGVDIVNRPTKFLAGEAGPELAAFVPLRDANLTIGGRVGVDVAGVPAGMDTGAIQQIVFAAMRTVAQRIRTAK